MYTKNSMMYIYVETPLHAGSGRAVGVVDLPIQRERVTNYPLVQSSGVKGRLRAEARDRKKEMGISDEEINAIFGPEAGSIKTDSDAFAGALSVGDARLLLFPVRSLYGVFAWTTSANVIARYLRDLTAVKVETNNWPDLTKLKVGQGQALVSGSGVVDGSTLVLEEFSYEATNSDEVKKLAAYLKAALPQPQSGEYTYWRDNLADHLVVLPEEDFRDFVTNSTEVVTRVRLDDDTKTVQGGALWTEESLPSDTLLYCPVFMGDSHIPLGNTSAKKMDAAAVQTALEKLDNKRVRLGGDETVGRGSVALHFVRGQAQ